MTPSSLFVQPNVFQLGLLLPLGHLCGRRFSQLSLLPTRSAAILGAPPSLLSLIFCLLSLPGWPAPSASVTIPGVAPPSGSRLISLCIQPPPGSAPQIGTSGFRRAFHVARVPPERNSPSLLRPVRHLSRSSLDLGPGRPYPSGLDSLVALPVFSSDINRRPGRPHIINPRCPGSLVHS